MLHEKLAGSDGVCEVDRTKVSLTELHPSFIAGTKQSVIPVDVE
jgi:hypothetical protein